MAPMPGDEKPLPLPRNLWVAVLLSCQTSVLFGWGLAQLNAVTGDAEVRGAMQKDVDITSTELTAAQVAVYVTALIAAVTGPKYIERLGARDMLLWNDVFYIVGGVLTAVPEVHVIIAGRLIMGLGVGLGTCCVPPLIAELSPTAHRGALGCLHQIFVTVGALAAALLGFAFCTYAEHGWVFANASFALPALLQLALKHRIPHSPRWLVRHGRPHEAEHVLRLYGDPDAAEEGVRAMQRELDAGDRNLRSRSRSGSAGTGGNSPRDLVAIPRDRAAGRSYEAGGNDDKGAEVQGPSWGDVFGLGWPAVVGFGLASYQSISGINVVVGYSTMLLAAAGLKMPIIGTIAVTFSNVVATIISGRTMDGLGRRALMLASSCVMTAGMLLAALALLAIEDEGTMDFLAIFALVAYIFGFALGIGPVPWVVMCEVVPSDLRSKAVSGFVASNWFCNCVVVGLTQVAINGLGGCALDASPDGDGDDDDCDNDKLLKGVGYLFLLLAVVCVTQTLFVAFVVPETKGVSLEGIQQRFRAGSAASATNNETWDQQTRALLADEGNALDQ